MNRLRNVGVLLVICVGCALLFAGSARSASLLTFGGGAQTGIAFSSFPSDIKDFYGTGFVVGAHGDLNIVKYFTARLSLDYYSFASDKTKLASIIANAIVVGNQPGDPSKTSVSGFNSTDFAINLSGIGKLPTSSLATPYAIAGFGLNFLSASDLSVSYAGLGDITQRLLELQIISKTESKTKFGMHLGVGSEFKFGIARLYAEFKYVIIFTEGSSTSLFPLVVGVTF